MAAAWQASGTLLGSTGADITPVWPTHATGDIAILIAASRVITETCSTPGGGWALLAGPADNTGWRVYAFWKRAASGSETDPLLDWSAAVGEKYGQIHTIRGAATSGDPFVTPALSVDLTDIITVTPGVTTSVANQLVVVAAIGSDNASSTVVVTSTDPASFTQRHYSTITTGNDATGEFHEAVRASAGYTDNILLNHNSTMPAEGVLRAGILEPTGTTHFGSVTLPLTATFVTAGFAKKTSSVTLPLTIAFTVAGFAKKTSSVTLSLTIDFTTAGLLVAKGSSTWPILIDFVTVSDTTKRGSVTLPIVASFDTAGYATKRSSATLPLTINISTAGLKTAKASATLPLAIAFDTNGHKATASSVTLPLAISFDTNGRKVGLVYDAGYPGHIASGYVGGTTGSSGYIATPTTGSVS